MKNKIIPIVLHKVVENRCIDFEDVLISSFKTILNKDPSSYITINSLSNLKESKSKFMYMITFDDGYLSDYKIVLPLLEALSIKATFFITTSNIGKPNYLDWKMVNEMHEKGHIFGSHGHNHLKMTEISLEESRYEFNKSKEMFEVNCGIDINLFAFPYGLYNNNLISLSEKCGYSNCFISKHGVLNSINQVVPRNSINSLMSYSDIIKTMNPSNFTRYKWKVEDLIKYFLKKILGEQSYLLLRRKFIENI